MIALHHGEEATLLCDETDVVTYPYLEGALPKYSFQAFLAFQHVLQCIPGTESISIQGVFLTQTETFIPGQIWVLAEERSGYLPSDIAGRILREAGFPAAIPPAPQDPQDSQAASAPGAPSAQRKAPGRHRQNPQTTHGASPPPAPSPQE